MPPETRAARGDRVLELAGAAVLFSERAKRDGRRVLPDPALEFFDARQNGLRAGYEPVTVTERVTDALFPSLSVTVSVTKYDPAVTKSCATTGPSSVWPSLNAHR